MSGLIKSIPTFTINLDNYYQNEPWKNPEKMLHNIKLVYFYMLGGIKASFQNISKEQETIKNH